MGNAPSNTHTAENFQTSGNHTLSIWLWDEDRFFLDVVNLQSPVATGIQRTGVSYWTNIEETIGVAFLQAMYVFLITFDDTYIY